MARFIEDIARKKNLARLITVSAQTFNFFTKRGFVESSPDGLPPERRASYDQSGRNSKVLVKELQGLGLNMELLSREDLPKRDREDETAELDGVKLDDVAFEEEEVAVGLEDE